jgi:hypothetical protein
MHGQWQVPNRVRARHFRARCLVDVSMIHPFSLSVTMVQRA